MQPGDQSQEQEHPCLLGTQTSSSNQAQLAIVIAFMDWATTAAIGTQHQWQRPLPRLERLTFRSRKLTGSSTGEHEAIHSSLQESRDLKSKRLDATKHDRDLGPLLRQSEISEGHLPGSARCW